MSKSIKTIQRCGCGCGDTSDSTCGCCGMKLSSGCDCPDDADADHQLTWGNLKTYTHAEVMDLVDEKTKSQKLMYEQEIQEIAYAVKIWPSELQQLQWSPGGLRDAIIERIKSGVGRDEYV